jgi:IclR family acetate operon transcriptional repressor
MRTLEHLCEFKYHQDSNAKTVFGERNPCLADRKEAYVKALDKALTVLEHFNRIEGDIDLSSLAKALHMPKTTLLRLLTTFKHHHFVQQDEQSRRFRLGWALIHLGQTASRAFNLAGLAHPHLERLAGQSGETANLILREDEHAIYVDQVVSPNIIRGVPAVGTPLDLHCTAAGKALLGFLPEAASAHLLSRLHLQRLTEKTITDPAKLRAELERVRRQGYAVDDEETELGGRCVAAPIYNQDGKVMAAVSIMGPTHRVNRGSIPRLAQMVMATAGEISRALGFEPAGK